MSGRSTATRGAGGDAGSARVRARVALSTLAILLAAASIMLPPASGQGPGPGMSTVTIADAVDRKCFDKPLDDGAPGVESVSLPGPELGAESFGVVEARLQGPSGGDWDLAVFHAASRELVAASSHFGSTEVAFGYLSEGGELLVQACRLSGTGDQAQLSLEASAVDAGRVPKASLAAVETPTQLDKDALVGLGLDLTEHGSDDHVAVVLHGAADRETLERAGFEYEIQVPNLGRQSVRQRAADASFDSQTRASSLPSGRDTYRVLADYSQEMKDLASANPDLVRPITLNHTTYEGRPVEGIEITTDPGNLADGKPVFLQMGVHHAREWPSGEHAIEWAHELVNGYKSGDARVRGLVESTRTIVIPVVNPDGFNASVSAGMAEGATGDDIVNFLTSPNEYRRKNCRFLDDSDGGSCVQPSIGLAEAGVDPNRNYGGFWGGPGASTSPTAQDYRGPGPFSEPESKNIQELISTRQVTTLITNHTFSNLLLRPPGVAGSPDPVDEPTYKALGDAMAQQNGYLSQKSFELYDTSGGTEDWSYYATGGLGFTFEIGCNRVDPAQPDPANNDCEGNFHPPYEQVVEHYEGMNPEAQALGGAGNREAYFIATENAADPAKHSVLEGNAPAGATLRIEKTFQTPTSVDDPDTGEPTTFEDRLSSELVVPASGRYTWHMNPSTRPLVAASSGRVAQGPPSAEVTFNGSAATTTPCADFETTDPGCWNDHPFEIPGGAGVDNDAATVAIEWAVPLNDWDIKVFRDTDGDGTSTVPDGPDDGADRDSEPASAQVGSSAQGAPGTSESTTFIRPEAGDGRLEPGKYVARVINFAVVDPAALDPYAGSVTFEGPEEFVPAITETWKLTCVVNGQVVASHDLLIARGERKQLDPCGSVRPGPPSPGGPCANRIEGTGERDKLRGTGGSDRIIGKRGNDRLKGRGGDDCLLGKAGRDKISGNAGDDDIRGGGGKDKIKANGGRDVIRPGRGKDKVKAGGGRDIVRAARGARDVIDCGPGKDTAFINERKDKVRRCEKVKLR